MFDHKRNLGHVGVNLFPLLEGIVGNEPAEVLKRNVDVDSGDAVDILDERNAGSCNLDEGAWPWNVAPLEMPKHAEERVYSIVHGPALVQVTFGYHDQIHVGRWQVELSGKGP